MRFRVFPAAVVVFVAAHAGAQSAPPSADRSVPDASRVPGEAAAHGHFERALVWYRAGKYRLAVAELDAALDRDPDGKDLVFNLALVQEKLGDLDGAIRSLQRFQGMEKDPLEIERAAQSIQRLEGARAEVMAAVPRRAPLSLAPCPVLRIRGKFDAWVAGAGGIAAASLVVGVVFAVRSLTLDSAADAHSASLISDIALSTGVLAGAGAAAFYFGRYRDVAPVRTAAWRLPQISAAWLELRY